MATSSITKQFVVKDYKAFEKLMAESAKTPVREALKHFSLPEEEEKVETDPEESETQAVIDNCLETIKACQETIEIYEKTIETYQAMIEERSNPLLEQEEKPISKLESTHSDYEAPKWEPSFWEKAGGFWDQFMETLGPGGLLFILALIGVWILKVFW